MKFRLLFSALVLCISVTVFSQTTNPKIYFSTGIVHQIVAISSDAPSYNFSSYYQIGFPTCVNVWKTSTVGFSMQFIPTIRSEKGISKMSNFLFHPGIMLALGKGYTFIGRTAFETSGRYGITPIFSKTIIKGKYSNVYVATPLPLRFGNDKPFSFSPSFEFGITF